MSATFPVLSWRGVWTTLSPHLCSISRLCAVHPIFAANGHLNGVDNEDADVEENGIDDDPDRQSRDRMGKGFVHDPRTGPGRSLCGNVVTDTFGILDQPVCV